MDRILLSTVAYRPPEEVFPYVQSFTDYPRYTDHLKSVSVHGDGGVDSIYDLHLAWWKLTYTARSRVTNIDAPQSLEWQLTNDIDARGEWRVEPEPDAAPPEPKRRVASTSMRCTIPTRRTKMRFHFPGSSR